MPRPAKPQSSLLRSRPSFKMRRLSGGACMLRDLKLRTKMLVVFLGFNLLISLISLSFTLSFSRRVLVTEVQNRALERVRSSAIAIDGFLKSKAKTAWTIGQDPDLLRWLAENKQRGISHQNDSRYQLLMEQFRAVVSNDPGIKSVFMACENTQEYFDHEERAAGSDYFVNQRPWYTEAVKRGRPTYDISYDLLDRRVYVSYNVPLYRDQALLGVTGVDISVETLEEFISDLKAFQHGIPLLVSHEGDVLFHPDTQRILQQKVTTLRDDGSRYVDVEGAVGRMLQGGEGIERVTWEGTASYWIYTTIAELGATLVLSVPADHIDEPLRSLAWVYALIIAGSLAGLVLVIVPFTRSITRPIERLAEISRRISRGDVSQRVEISRKDEIGVLADSFQQLIGYVKRLASAAEALKRDDRHFELTPQSDQDVLSMNFVTITRSIYGMIDEMSRVIAATRQGKVEVRCNTEAFEGSYRQVMVDVNQMLDSVIQPISEAIAALDRIASNDLSVRIRGDYRGEFARMKEAFNQAVGTLDQQMARLEAISQEVSGVSSRINETSQELAGHASEQEKSVTAVWGRLNGVAEMTSVNAQKADAARNSMRKALQSTQEGVGSMGRLSEAIERIKSSSDETAKIVKTIDEIAFQTNLLALNAAVEAARAGAAGRGFNVVAEEVRRLAMRSAEAAKQTSLMIDEAVRKAESGVNLNQEVVQNLNQINEHVSRVGEFMDQIASGSGAQQEGIHEIKFALDQLREVSGQNASASADTLTSAGMLFEQAAEMHGMVSSFEVSSAELRAAAPRKALIPKN
jgi:methyl-accepting chemotaxis protein